jgi:hypothetical protein
MVPDHLSRCASVLAVFGLFLLAGCTSGPVDYAEPDPPAIVQGPTAGDTAACNYLRDWSSSVEMGGDRAASLRSLALEFNLYSQGADDPHIRDTFALVAIEWAYLADLAAAGISASTQDELSISRVLGFAREAC